jgi:hypothetical protein
LPEADQNLLFQPGAGATTKQGLLDRLASLTAGNSSGLIDASTRGRNNARTTVKTPVESILAADPTLAIPRQSVDTRNVTVDGRTAYGVQNVQNTVANIRRANAYPTLQGQDNIGYRAIAEKLQPPLRDTTSGQVRVLVEHRVGGLVDAVNSALAGNPRDLGQIANAANRLDSQRNRLPEPILRQTPSERGQELQQVLPTESNIINSPRSEELQQIGRPNILPPPQDLDLQNLAAHYDAGIQWANGQGTFSNEFAAFRNDLNGTLDVLRQNRLNQTTVDDIGNRLPGIMAANDVLPNGPYVGEDIQQRIFDAYSVHYGRYLWGLLRYFTQHD